MLSVPDTFASLKSVKTKPSRQPLANPIELFEPAR
jgi:hypothetical protein